MRKRVQFLAVISMISLFLAGCGDELYELTDEERELITTYSAYVVALHNTFQKDGLVSLTMPETESEFTYPEPEPESEIQQNTENESGNSSSGGGGSNSESAETQSMTLAEAIGHGSDLSVSFDGCKVDDHYTQGQGYSLTASEGMLYIIAEFTLKNISDKTVKIDNLSLNPSFRCHYNGSENAVGAEVTFLDNDLGSYEGSIKAGKSANAVLLFSIPDTKGNRKISDFTLAVMIGGVVTDIKL